MTKMSGTFLNSGACDAGPQGEGKESPSNTGRLQTAGREKYQPYPDYKDSGVEWVDLLPLHWTTCHLRWISNLYAGGTPDKTNLAYWDNGTIPWLSSGEVNQRLVKFPTTKITEDAYRSSSAKWVPKGSLVMALAGQGKTKGTIAQLDIDTTCNQSMAAIVPARDTCARYFYYWLDSNYRNIRGLTGDGLRDGLNLELLGSIDIPLVPEKEASTIAAFLDYETARIDQLIAKQQQLIELLKEKRQAVISHAVTKGLNPNAPMKDSGVEWLGQVPEHWVIKKISWDFSAQKGRNGQILTKEYCGQNQGSYPVYSGQTENDGVMGYISTHEFDFGSEGCLFSTTVGAKAMTLSLLKGKFSLSQNCMIITKKPQSHFNIEFSFFHFQPLFRYERGLIPEHMQASFRMEDLYQYSVAAPSIEEQICIVSHIKNETLRIDKLIQLSTESILYAQERRTALISAAVTGKIDLRGWQPPKSEVAA